MEPPPDHPEAQDAELLEMIRAGEPEAFERFVDRFGDQIFGFGYRMCGHREDAREVVQDTLLASYRSLRKLKHHKAMRSWVYRVAANACLMMRRKGKHEPDREISLDEVMPRFKDGALPEIPDVSALPDEELARSELNGIIRQAVDALPPLYRVVLVMRDMDGLSTHEVAEALGVPGSTVKMRLHRARLQARKTIADLAGGTPAGGGR